MPDNPAEFPVGRRATTLAELRVIRSRFDTRASLEQGLAFTPAPDDVLIATYPKCGTTWLQQILHTLRTGGDMDFREITEVVPWLEMAGAMNIAIDAPQRASPRVFKTHLSFENIPKGGRYIHMVRAPEDVLVSMYHFHQGWFFEPGSIALDDYALEHFLAGGRSGKYWEFQASWWRERHSPDVLYLVYEHALQAPRQTIAQIARFAGIALDDALLDLTEHHASLAFMKSHASRFDDNLFRAVSDPARGLPEDSTTTKVRRGTAGEGKARVSQAINDVLDEQWARTMTAEFGLRDYAHLCAAAPSV